MKRLVSWLELIVQFLWLAFLIVLVIGNEGKQLASEFLNPKYFWLLYLSIVFFSVFLSNTLIKILARSEGKKAAPIFIYLLIPLFFLPASLKAKLGSAAVTRRGVVFQEIQKSDFPVETPETLVSPFTGAALEFKNTDGTDQYLELLSNPEESLGRNVNIVGQAAFNPLLPEGSFYIFRFIIFCCAADATPSGFIVTGIDSSDVETDQWYRVRGRIGMTSMDGIDYLSIGAQSLEHVDELDPPFESY